MNLTINEALHKAVESHKTGQLQEAERLYNAILKVQPKHPDANHNMGVLAVGVGKLNEALPFLKIALEANPKMTQFWLSYVDALIKLDRIADAKAVLNQAKSKGATGDGFDQLEERLQKAGQVLLEADKITEKPQPEKPNILDSLKLDQAIKLAKRKSSSGSPGEAKRIYKDILTKFPKNKRASDELKALTGGMLRNTIEAQDPPRDQLQSLINLYHQGLLQQALKQVETLVQKYPKASSLFNIQGAILKGLGQLDASVEAYEKALAIKSDYAGALFNMGNTLKEQGKLKEASDAYKKAIAINPDDARIYFNLGNTLKERGKLEEASDAYTKSLTIKPDYDRAYFNLGVTLQDRGKRDDAIVAYKKAIAIKSDDAEAYNNMGIVLQDQGNLEQAIASYNRAIEINPDYDQAYFNIGHAIKGVAFNAPNPILQKTITNLLDKNTFIRPSEIARVGIGLLKFEFSLMRHLRTSSLADVELDYSAVIKDLSTLPLLLKLMSICPLPDLELEHLLRELRKSLLLSVADLTGSEEELTIQSALALQCFTNEYIYDLSEEEGEAVKALEWTIKQALINNEQPSPQTILCLASYNSLGQYEWSSSLIITNYIEDVFTRQVLEPIQETKFRSMIPILGEITDNVSSRVRDQYEVSPYPRWVNLGLPWKPQPIATIVQKFNLKPVDGAITGTQFPKILVAGCGTGQHALETAARFEDSKILAIDLSLTSLCYAKRKSEELGINNINYMQANILDLGKLNRQFDIIESVGVLHHMHDPFLGLKILTDCLKPNGIMRIGLYSKLARQHIAAIHQEIKSNGIGSSDIEIKSFRAKLLSSDREHHKRLHNSTDFYSLSNFKDLLFHVQEHRFTITEIKDFLYSLDLKFCGFESNHIVSQFKQYHPGDDDPFDLDLWQEYEVGSPKTFAGMYQFWCQKLA